MDKIIGCLMFLVMVIQFVETRQTQDVPRWLRISSKTIKIRHHHGDNIRKEIQQHVEIIPMFNSSKSSSSCCLNGGRCIIGSFCKCPKNFYGRRCEHKNVEKPCGRLMHAVWVKSDCNLCRCFNGLMNCIPISNPGCDAERTKQDRMRDVYIFPPKRHVHHHVRKEDVLQSAAVQTMNRLYLLTIVLYILC
ncbi:hypothetical protein SNE40_022545 [Patella caerulea]|uniref:EGF-like domain-containing protein n=1 Tax=Patella caerulea TaxID=87958 RepID=A0AAN8FWT1_PATCE